MKTLNPVTVFGVYQAFNAGGENSYNSLAYRALELTELVAIDVSELLSECNKFPDALRIVEEFLISPAKKGGPLIDLKSGIDDVHVDVLLLTDGTKIHLGKSGRESVHLGYKATSAVDAKKIDGIPADVSTGGSKAQEENSMDETDNSALNELFKPNQNKESDNSLFSSSMLKKLQARRDFGGFPKATGTSMDTDALLGQLSEIFAQKISAQTVELSAAIKADVARMLREHSEEITTKLEQQSCEIRKLRQTSCVPLKNEPGILGPVSRSM